MSFLPYAPSSARTWWMAGGSATMMHGAFIAFGLISAQGLLVLSNPTPQSEPAYTITLTPLNSDTIAGLTLQDGIAGADDNVGIEQIQADNAPRVEAESLAALVPSSEVVSPAIALAPSRAETVQPVAPSTPSQPEETASPLIPDIVMPAQPQITSGVPVTLAPATPAPTAVETVQPTNPVPAVKPPTTPAQTLAAAPATAAPSAQDIAIADLLQRIRSAPNTGCLVALPRRDGTDGVGLALIASADGAMSQFSADILTSADADLRQTRTLVDERQCSALNYIRQNIDYPATKMGVQLDTATVPSGGRLTGVLRGAAGRYLTLLLIDNNGVVQDLQRFLSFSGSTTRFDVPVTRFGPQRDAKQLLLAIATRNPAPVFQDRAGQLAQDVFAGLTGQIADQAALAVVAFEVR